MQITFRSFVSKTAKMSQASQIRARGRMREKLKAFCCHRAVLRMACGRRLARSRPSGRLWQRSIGLPSATLRTMMQTSCTYVARRPKRQRGFWGRFVSPLLSLGQPAVPLLARRPAAAAGEDFAKGRIGRSGCARVLQPRAPFARAVRDQSNTEVGRAVERQAPRLRWTRAQAPGGAARGGTSCGLHGSAQRFGCRSGLQRSRTRIEGRGATC